MRHIGGPEAGTHSGRCSTVKLQSTGREEAEAEFVVRREGRWSKRARRQAEWAV